MGCEGSLEHPDDFIVKLFTFTDSLRETMTGSSDSLDQCMRNTIANTKCENTERVLTFDHLFVEVIKELLLVPNLTISQKNHLERNVLVSFFNRGLDGLKHLSTTHIG